MWKFGWLTHIEPRTTTQMGQSILVLKPQQKTYHSARHPHASLSMHPSAEIPLRWGSFSVNSARKTTSSILKLHGLQSNVDFFVLVFACSWKPNSQCPTSSQEISGSSKSNPIDVNLWLSKPGLNRFWNLGYRDQIRSLRNQSLT